MRENILTLIVVWLVVAMLGAIVQTQEYGHRETAREPSREMPTQFQTSGVDKEYVHGTWCVDGRAF